MRKERKINTIRALKHELSFYKRQLVGTRNVYKADLEHLRLEHIFTREEVMQMPKDEMPPLLQQGMVKAFEDAIMMLPIETEFDERFGVHRASIDLWVKPKIY